MGRWTAACLLGSFLTGCADGPPEIRIQIGDSGSVAAPNFIGLVAGGEPEAVLAAKDLLITHGNAVDAAAALGLVLAVTLPSRAGLDASGACLVRSAKTRVVEVLSFDGGTSATERNAPLAEGLFALHARYGTMPWGQIVAPAEQLARFGTRVSRALAKDVQAYGGALIDDRATFVLFSTSQRQLIATGDRFTQPQLAASLAALRMRGVRPNVPATHWNPSVRQNISGTDVFTLSNDAAPAAPVSPATSFTVADADGMIVACVISMGQPFGQARLVADTGYLAAAPVDVRDFGAVIVMNPNTGEARAAAAGGRDPVNRFAMAAAKSHRLAEISAVFKNEDAGMINAWACPTGLQTDGRSCDAMTQSSKAGYALVITPEDA